MKKFYAIIAVIIIVTALILRGWQYWEGRLKHGTVKIGNAVIEVEVAKTLTAQERGLSGRENLNKNEGMLFVFPEKDFYSFWMKEMKFPIDIIWIADDRVADIAYNVPTVATEFLKTYQPKEPVNFVLEVNAGFSLSHDIKVGDGVKIDY
jgi:uncharacterized membrane protein (UPF0127 family)